MRPESEYQEAMALLKEGLGPTEVSRRLAIPRGTVREWQAASAREMRGRSRHGRDTRVGSGEPGQPCSGCLPKMHDPQSYAYLLGMYLGDGSMVSHPRGVFRFRITCDLRYPDIIEEVATAISVVRGSSRMRSTA